MGIVFDDFSDARGGWYGRWSWVVFAGSGYRERWSSLVEVVCGGC